MRKTTITEPEGTKCKECNAPLCGCDANDAGIIHYGCKHFTDDHKSYGVTRNVERKAKIEIFNRLWDAAYGDKEKDDMVGIKDLLHELNTIRSELAIYEK